MSALLDELPAVIHTYGTYMHARITHLLPVPGWHFHFFLALSLAPLPIRSAPWRVSEALIGASAAAASARALGILGEMSLRSESFCRRADLSSLGVFGCNR